MLYSMALDVPNILFQTENLMLENTGFTFRERKDIGIRYRAFLNAFMNFFL